MNTETETTNTNGTPTAELLSRLLLTREQAAELLGVPASTIDYLHRVRQLPGVRIGKRLAWKPETVRAFVDALEPAE